MSDSIEKEKQEVDQITQDFGQALDLLIEKFVDWRNLDATQDKIRLTRIALAQATKSLGDPFTNYLGPDNLHRYKTKKQGKSEGIGLELLVDIDEKVRIVSAIKGSPSDVPQIKSGMSILAIDDQPAGDLNNQQIAQKVNGAPGTEVKLLLAEEQCSPIEMSFTRSAYVVQHIRAELLQSDIAYFRITWFSGTLFEQFQILVNSMIEQGAKGIVLDIRTTSGGSTINARKIFSAFCAEEVMYYAVGKGNIKFPDKIFGETFLDLPLVIIVNNRSYSAAEILPGALQDYGRAIVVGEKTAGKGIMQNVFPLGGEIAGALRITTAANTSPKGRIFQQNGIEPDVTVPLEFAELFVDNGPQNISDQGRLLLRQSWEQRLRKDNDSEVIDLALEQGDKQLNRALEEIKKLIL